MKKASKSTLKKRADKIFSEKIRSKGYCELEGLDKIKCSDQLQCMHIIGRSNFNLRWDSVNALCGCSSHHMFYTHHPLEFYDLMEKHFKYRMKYVREYQHERWDKDIEKKLEELKDWQP